MPMSPFPRRRRTSDGTTEDPLSSSRTPSPNTKPEDGTTSSDSVQQKQRDEYQEHLEERISDLETKLAVLSRLLQSNANTSSSGVLGENAPQQQQQGRTKSLPGRIASFRRPSSPPPPIETLPTSQSSSEKDSKDLGSIRRSHQECESSPMRSANRSMINVPYLESPNPLTPGREKPFRSLLMNSKKKKRGTLVQHKDDDTDVSSIDRVSLSGDSTGGLPTEFNLSFRVLYADESDFKDEPRSEGGPATNALTPAEVGARVLEFDGDTSTPTTPDDKSTEAVIKSNQAMLKSIVKEKTAENESKSMTEKKNSPDDDVRNKWLDYLNSFQEMSTPDLDVQMEEFIKVPAGVEHIMSFGFLICVDSFLYMVTVLPIRSIWSLLLLIRHFVSWKEPTPQFRFHRRHAYQLIQVTILYTIYRYVLAAISIGKLYHWIRGQAMIKLYVLLAMLEVFDRLLSSLGQDCMESMYWNTISRPRSSRFVISVAVVFIYASVHAIFLLVHVETLNVAMNSADEALLTLLISGNFAEIKSTVFKKYNKAALFKITASDICERFKLGLFLSLVLMLNLSQAMERVNFWDYLRVCGTIWCAEVLADWIKHAFITKFNFLPARVYPEYALLLAGDVTGIGHEGVNLDHSHAVVKRIGFPQIPLVCVMFRLVREAIKYATINIPPTQISQWFWIFMVLGLWLVLVVIKSALGRVLHRSSMAKLHSAPEYSQLTPWSKKKKA